MGLAVTITSGKGGVGKSTITVNLAYALARCNKRVVIVDADIGLKNIDVMLGLENRVIFDLANVLYRECRIDQALIRDKHLDNLFILPGTNNRYNLDISRTDFRRLIHILKKHFDYVLIDSPAGIESGFEIAISHTDMALIVVNPTITAVKDADRVIGILDYKNVNQKYLVINRVTENDNLSIDNILDILAIDLVGIIYENESIIKCTNKQDAIITDNNNHTNHVFLNMAKRLLGEKIPLEAPPRKKKRSILQTIASKF